MERPRPAPTSETGQATDTIPAPRAAPTEPLTMGSMPTGEELRARKVTIGGKVYVRAGRNTIVRGNTAYRFNGDGTYTPMRVLSGWDIEGDIRDEDHEHLLYQYDPAKAPKEE